MALVFFGAFVFFVVAFFVAPFDVVLPFALAAVDFFAVVPFASGSFFDETLFTVARAALFTRSAAPVAVFFVAMTVLRSGWPVPLHGPESTKGTTFWRRSRDQRASFSERPSAGVS